GIVSRNGHHADTVSHDDVLALPRDAEARLLQGANRVQVVDARQLRHGYASTATSRTVLPQLSSPTTSRYSRIAAAMFSSASFSVAPCEWQPGSPGTYTAKPSS